ncbi:hypothetical protein XACb0020 (plasmid) [Xanthomonas citri pv. citri str. 306]|uniref:Uncharacterized protein n=1 Tax=Xanthomonas axonopodis pv. citri (strain 306) TaxID=190486 RepID=A0AAI8ETS9_XANAC|nr:hypothetical protein XACa0017 [Xanthomonas citri pv. citri str. 306]AAM39266.1 hypothetical protein XACb0020 [Xanthomonas citri pv. citri str. 306]
MHWERLGFAPPGWLAWNYIRQYVPKLQVPFVGISPFLWALRIYIPTYILTYLLEQSRSNSTPATTSGSPLGQRLGDWWSLMTCTSVSSLTTATSAACKAACLLARSDRFWGRMFKSVGRYIYTYRVTGPGMHPAGRGPAAALPIGMYIHR